MLGKGQTIGGRRGVLGLKKERNDRGAQPGLAEDIAEGSLLTRGLNGLRDGTDSVNQTPTYQKGT